MSLTHRGKLSVKPVALSLMHLLTMSMLMLGLRLPRRSFRVPVMLRITLFR